MTGNTKTRLILAASVLFRRKGYHGVGLSEILKEAGVPKGSLYHHFPEGKKDLAIASAEWASRGFENIIDEAFAQADSFEVGATTLCHKLAKFFDISGNWDGCPVSSILLDGPENDAFQSKISEEYQRWTNRLVDHGKRLGTEPNEATRAAKLLLIGIHGSWAMARANRSSNELRRLPHHLGFS